jgi:hypothetical protein
VESEDEDVDEAALMNSQGFWAGLHREDRESAREGQAEVSAALGRVAAVLERLAGSMEESVRRQGETAAALERMAKVVDRWQESEARTVEETEAGTNDPKPADEEEEEEEKEEEKEEGPANADAEVELD